MGGKRSVVLILTLFVASLLDICWAPNVEQSEMRHVVIVRWIRHHVSNESSAFERESRCFGSMVTFSSVLTGCHCVQEWQAMNNMVQTANVRHLLVRAARRSCPWSAFDDAPASEFTGVSRVHTHPRCDVNEPTLKNDFAYLTLVAPLKKVSPLRLELDHRALEMIVHKLILSGQPCRVAQCISGTFLEINVQLMTDKNCMSSLVEYPSYYEDMKRTENLCGKMLVDPKTRLCFADMGSVLDCTGVAVAIMSWSLLCGNNLPVFFADLDVALDFLGAIHPSRLSKTSDSKGSADTLSLGCWSLTSWCVAARLTVFF